MCSTDEKLFGNAENYSMICAIIYSVLYILGFPRKENDFST